MRLVSLGSRRRRLAALAVGAVAAGGLAALPALPANAAAGCSVAYTVQSQWPGGFTAAVTITNLGSPITSWTLAFGFPAAGQAVTNGWSATWSQTGQNVTAASMSYNGSLATNGSAAIGFNGAWTGSNPVPTSFTLNGTVCTGTVTGSGSASASASASASRSASASASASASRSASASASASSSGNGCGSGVTCPHVDNPYVGAIGYVNPDWAAEVKAGAASVGGTLGASEAKVAQYSTAVWMDSMAAVSGGTGYTRSLAGHLDQAVAQSQAAGQPVVIEIVVYDLPGRDCAALASNGEIPLTTDGLNTYEHSYIDPIAATINQAKYSNLRVVAIIEPDSLPNLVTNLNIQQCATANSSGIYVTGVQYALNKLHAISNVYNYVDIGHDGWLGWTSNFSPAVTLIGNAIKGTTAGVNSIDGFISDTANYTPVTEPYMTANQSIGGNPVRSANFYQWNTYIDEQSFDVDWRNAMISAGFPGTIGMLIDTGRDGWGGPNRPAGPSTSTDLNTFVNATRIDKRIARGNWCNQPGGIGARPTANPAAGFDAYVWIKPPGESDGSSSLIPTGPQNPTGKGFDRMCDPTYGGNSLNNNNPTGAMANAPVSGAWFQAAFDTLVTNAYPPL